MLDSINMSLGYHVSLVEGYSSDKEGDELVLVVLVHTLEQLNESWLAKSWCTDDRLNCFKRDSCCHSNTTEDMDRRDSIIWWGHSWEQGSRDVSHVQLLTSCSAVFKDRGSKFVSVPKSDNNIEESPPQQMFHVIQTSIQSLSHKGSNLLAWIHLDARLHQWSG